MLMNLSNEKTFYTTSSNIKILSVISFSLESIAMEVFRIKKISALEFYFSYCMEMHYKLFPVIFDREFVVNFNIF